MYSMQTIAGWRRALERARREPPSTADRSHGPYSPGHTTGRREGAGKALL